MAETTDEAGKTTHIIPIKEAFEGRHGVAYHEVRSKYKEPLDIHQAFQVALEVLDILFSNKVLHQNENKSKRIRKQLQNQTVAVSVLGRHGVGKSTLLDSLLMERLLPTHRKNNTAVMVTIQHSPNLEDGPRLLDSQKQLVATGKEEILKYITTENDSVRTNNKMLDDLYLQLDCPVLKSATGEAKPVLVDTPGFGEAGGALIDRIAGESLDGCSACLMVMAYTMLRDEADMEILKQLHNSDPDLSNGRRIVIAVTQHDHYYTGKQDEELSAETTQDHVHEGLQQLGFTVPREQIVIVSGEWALMARELTRDQGNRELFQRARKFLTFYKDIQAKGAGKDDYDVFEDVARMDAATIARELEEASNIKDLEARVVEMSGRCGEILLSSAKNKVSFYMQQALDEMNIHLETACSKYQAEQRQEERIAACVAQVRSQKEAIAQTIVTGEGSDVHTCLKEKVDRETEVACNKTQRTIRRKLFQLRTQCLAKVEAQIYTTEMYHEDLNRVEEELGTLLRNALHSSLYSRSQSRSNRYMQYRIPHSFHRMEGVVRELGGASEVSRMMSTPEPEPVEVDDSIIEEESEEEEEELGIGASAATLSDEPDEVREGGEEGAERERGGEGEGEGEGEGQEGEGEASGPDPVKETSSSKKEVVKSSDDVRRDWPREGDSVDGIMGSNVDISSLVGDKEEQLQLKQLVESHHIDLPALRRYSSWKKFKLYMRIVFKRRKTTDPVSIAAARRSKYRQVQMTEEEVRQGFLDIMEAYKEEVTFLFYQENSGVRDQVFNYFFSEYRTDVEQKLATFQSKYGKILERQDTVLKETNDRMGELAEKIQDLEFIVSLMEGLATRFKPTSAVV